MRCPVALITALWILAPVAARSAKAAEPPKPNVVVAVVPQSGFTIVVGINDWSCVEYQNGVRGSQCLVTQVGPDVRITDAFSAIVVWLHGDMNGGFVLVDGKQIGTYSTAYVKPQASGWINWIGNWAANFSRNVQALQAQRTQQLQQDQQALQRRQQQEDLNSQLLQLRQQIERTNQCLSYGNCY